ncbi:MAG TPA: hypothetical protein VGL35_14485 [Rhizomicrobium sp.]|jgi:hypothetical protein
MTNRDPSEPRDALFLCVRVPKSGSESLRSGLARTFAERRIFYLPDTLDLDGQVSRLQRLRFHRSRFQNLFRHYRSFDIRNAFRRIEREGMAGDLVMGGHIDFRTATANIARSLRIIALLRHPLTRARSEYDYLRRGYLRKPRLNRFDASVLHKAAGRYAFDSYLDYLFAHRAIYGDVACRYLGWSGREDLAQYFAANVFHCGVLERSREFETDLSEKLGRPFSLPHENRVDVERPALTRSQRAKLEAIYPHDFQLYEQVSTCGEFSSPSMGEVSSGAQRSETEGEVG